MMEIYAGLKAKKNQQKWGEIDPVNAEGRMRFC